MKKGFLVLVGMIVLSHWSFGWELGEPTSERITNEDGLVVTEQLVNDMAWRYNLRMYDPDFFDRQESLAGDGIITIGLEGSCGYAPTIVDSTFQSALYADASILINHRFKIGAVGQMFKTDIAANDVIDGVTNSGTVAVGFGAITIGYVFMPEKLFHFSIYGGAGGGVMTVSPDLSGGIVQDPLKKQTLFAVGAVMAGAEAELNLAKALKLKIGAGYRYIFNATEQNLGSVTDEKLSGVYGNISLTLGLF